MRMILSRFERASSWIAGLFVQVAALAAFVLVATVTYGVAMRFVFNDAQNWTDELATYSLLWIVFFGLAHTLLSDSHIRIDFIIAALPDRVRRWVEIAVHLLGLAFAALLVFGAWSAISNFIKRGTNSISGLDMPLWIPATPLLLGSAAFALVMLLRTIRLLVDDQPPLPPGKPHKDLSV